MLNLSFIEERRAITRWLLGLFLIFGLAMSGLFVVGCGAGNPSTQGEEFEETGDFESTNTSNGDGGANNPDLAGRPQDAGPKADVGNKLPDGDISNQVKIRQCPNQLSLKPTTDFKGSPCSDTDPLKCSTSCIPGNLGEFTSEPDTFFSDCGKESVICVGPKQEVKTISEAARKAESNKSITHIRIASGRYVESVTFTNVTQDLKVEGQSNEPGKGAIVVAPLPPRPVKDYATLKFVRAGNLTIQRLVVSGYGHGLVVDGFISVNINNSHHTTNLLSGAWIKGDGKVTVRDSRFHYNGGVLRTLPTDTISVNINNSHRTAGQGTISVNINNSHRVVGNDSIAVNINNSHRLPGLKVNDTIAVNINNSHRTVGTWRTQVEALQFGLVVERAKEVSLEHNRFTANAVGGLRVSPGGDEIAVNINNSHRIGTTDHISVNINNSHRVVGNDTIAVNINNSHRVAMNGNRIADNGPRGWFAASQAKAPGCGQGCSGSHFCENNVCMPKLGASIPKGAKPQREVLLGVGALVAGYGDVQMEGNSFFRNDVSGAFVRSADTVVSQQNAWEFNGQRPSVLQPRQFVAPNASFVGVTQRLEVVANLVTDSPGHGIVVVGNKSSSSQPVDVVMTNNFVDGIGRTLALGANLSDGIRLDNTRASLQLKADLKDNYFTNNRRSGLALFGFVTGTIRGNFWWEHPYRAITVHDSFSEISSSNSLTIERNRIDRASGYGIQLFGGGAAVILRQNTISNVRGVGGSDEENAEGDAINLSNVKAMIEVLDNIISNNHRAGIFMHSIKARLENNRVSGCRYGSMMQNGSSYSGTNDMEKNKNKSKEVGPSGTDLPNRKDF